MKLLCQLLNTNKNEKLRAICQELGVVLALSPKLLALSLIQRIFK